MTLGLELSNQWLPNPVTVTLHKYQSDGVYVPQTVPRCQRAAAEVTTSSDGQIVVPVNQVVFHLWAVELAGARPEAQDVIEHAGERFTVGPVEVLSHGARFKCHCLKEVS